MIEFHNVHKSFGKLEVLKGIDFKIEKGQVVTLIGPSGSGKSTILRCINLLEKPDSGTVLIEGQDITEKKADIQRIRKDIGMVFQHFNLFPHMTVMENMIYAPVRVNGLSKEEAKKKAMELLALVGLTEKADAFPISCPAARSRESPLPERLPWNRRLCCLTSLPAPWIRKW